MPLIVTGCQRSGTKTIANLLSINHEQQFSYTEPDFKGQSEVSWLAAPYLKQLKAQFLHLVRHPINVINSMEGIKFWQLPDHLPYRTFILNHTTIKSNISLIMSMQYWYQWNLIIQKIKMPRIRIEDFKNITPLNSRARAGIKDWDQLPHGDDKDNCRELAKSYGYT